MLLQISEIQRPKANHNEWHGPRLTHAAVTNIRNSKTESKSQLDCIGSDDVWSCYKYQKFKDRKQITTNYQSILSFNGLLQISEIQRPKANHNRNSMNVVFPVLLQISEIQRPKANHN